MAHCFSLSHLQSGKLMFCREIKFWFPALQIHQLNLRSFSDYRTKVVLLGPHLVKFLDNGRDFAVFSAVWKEMCIFVVGEYLNSCVKTSYCLKGLDELQQKWIKGWAVSVSAAQRWVAGFSMGSGNSRSRTIVLLILNADRYTDAASVL